MTAIVARKLSHLDLCTRHDVETHGGTLLDEVHLLHEALPELCSDEVDPSASVLGRRLRAPLLISGMSGGAPQGKEMNRCLASVAQRVGIGMGVGSQRAMLVDPSTTDSYQVRDVAPDILLLANIGATQARDAGVGRVAGLVEAIGADALCVHLNAAQEIVQDEGDRDFRGCLGALAEIAARLPVPLVVKETGCGFAPATLDRLRSAGVAWIDVSGSGGTTWTGVEALRGSARQRALGSELREWGIPTAASLLYATARGFCTIASGGIRSAVDCARALNLGAEAVSLALPFLRSYRDAGAVGVAETAQGLVEGIRGVMLLTGSRRIADLRRVPRVLGPHLRAWLELDAGSRPVDSTEACRG